MVASKYDNVVRRWASRLASVALSCGLSMLSAATTAQEPEADVTAPVYVAKDCCTLCPKASDPDSYATTFLKDYLYLVQGEGQWLFRTEAELNITAQKDELVWDDLERMVKDLNARGTQILVYLSAPRAVVQAERLTPEVRARFDYDGLLKNYQGYLEHLRKVGFIVPPADRFASVKKGEDFHFQRDAHWNPSGAKRAAELIAEYIKPLNFNFPPKTFVTKPSSVITRRGTIAFAADVICGSRYPTESSIFYETTAPATDDLFGDEPIPEIALVGTSFSGSAEYHFMGFLRAALQTDMLQNSFAGAGFDGSITQYLASPAFQKAPPKLIVWEFPYQFFGRADHATMRRIVPLVNNGCVNRKALISNEVELTNDGDYKEVLFNGGSNFITEKSKNLIVDMQFSDPNVREISSEIWYLDGRHELIRSRYNQFTNMEGRFVMELNRAPEYADQPVVDYRLQVLTTLGKPVKVKAAMCSALEPGNAVIKSGAAAR